MSKRYHHGDLRNALIRAGQTILAEEGVAALDLRKVARAAGVSHAAPYRHFADKQALLAAIAEQGFEQLAARMRAALADAPEDVRSQLMFLAHAYVGFAFEHPAHMREMFSGLTLEHAAYPTLHAAAKAAFQQVIQVVQRAQSRQAIGPGDPASLATIVWSQIHGVTMLLIEDQIMNVKGDERAVAQLLGRCVRVLYDGLRAGLGD